MASDGRGREKVGRKLTKRRREPRRVSLDIPDRFKDGEDAQDDVTAPKSKDGISMNQSIFSMIARAGQQSQTDLATMPELDSGDSDDEAKRDIPYRSLDGAARLSRLNTINDFQKPLDEIDNGDQPNTKHRRGFSEHKLLRSLPKLKMSSRKEGRKEAPSEDLMSSSQILSRPSVDTGIELPVGENQTQKHKQKPRAGEEPYSDRPRPSSRRSRHGSVASTSKPKPIVTLAKRLQQIFDFETPEDIISGRCQNSLQNPL